MVSGSGQTEHTSVWYIPAAGNGTSWHHWTGPDWEAPEIQFVWPPEPAATAYPGGGEGYEWDSRH